MKKREFYGEDHYAWLQQTFDAARVYLKNCGKPKDEYDRWLISEAKWTCQAYKKCLE